MAEHLASFLGWTFIPSLATRFAQSVFYSVTVRAGGARPAPGSPAWARHNRRIYSTIVAAYLLYTVYDAYDGVRRAGDFYRALGVAHDAGDRAIKSRFRRLAALHHPDKLAADDAGNATDTVFLRLRLAQDTLLEPAARFAYDRFGPAMLEWQHCVTIGDYLSAGFQATAPLYLVLGIGLVMSGVMGYVQWGRFWRYLALASFAVLEFHTATRPAFPPLLHHLNALLGAVAAPPLLPFQLLVLARKVNLALFIAIMQLGPFFRGGDGTPPGAHPDAVPPHLLAHLERLAHAHEAEAGRLLHLGMAPHVGDAQARRDLQDRIREWLVRNTIEADPRVREAVGEALRQERAQASGE